MSDYLLDAAKERVIQHFSNRVALLKVGTMENKVAIICEEVDTMARLANEVVSDLNKCAYLESYVEMEACNNAGVDDNAHIRDAYNAIKRRINDLRAIDAMGAPFIKDALKTHYRSVILAESAQKRDDPLSDLAGVQ